MKLIVKNGSVANCDLSAFENRDLFLVDGVIVDSLRGEPDEVIDARGKYVIPGLIDIHTHGSLGVNYSKDRDFEKALRFSAERGVTTVVPTIGVRPMEEILAAIDSVKNNCTIREGCAAIGGIHLEGPFVSKGKLGAMNMPDFDASLDNFIKIADYAGELLRVMTIAPERECALEIISEGAARGIRMSLGHTLATYEEAMRGIEAGATGATHTFNAMVGLSHREPGVLGAVLTDPRVSCEVICDMVHLAPATVKLIAAAKGKENMILVSDSGAVTGMPDGEYIIDGRARIIKDGVSRNVAGNIAGSCFSMADGARRLVENGFSLLDVARVGALNPAKAVRIDGVVGTLECGKRADLIICDDSFNVDAVYVRGARV